LLKLKLAALNQINNVLLGKPSYLKTGKSWGKSQNGMLQRMRVGSNVTIYRYFVWGGWDGFPTITGY